jgi:hypothetical protein
MISRLPFFKILAVAQVALLARRHLKALTPMERRRMRELALQAHKLQPHERQELIDLAMKLEPRAFAGSVANRMSPVPLPKRFVNGRGARGQRMPVR